MLILVSKPSNSVTSFDREAWIDSNRRKLDKQPSISSPVDDVPFSLVTAQTMITKFCDTSLQVPYSVIDRIGSKLSSEEYKYDFSAEKSVLNVPQAPKRLKYR